MNDTERCFMPGAVGGFQVPRWSFVVLGFVVTFCELQAQQVKQRPNEGVNAKAPIDYYMADGKPVKLEIIPGQIGVVAAEGVPPAALESFLGENELKTVKMEFGGIHVVEVVGARDSIQLESLVRTLTDKNSLRENQAIQQAGLLVKTEGAKTPMLLTAEFVVEFQDNVDPDFIANLNEKYVVEIVRKNPFRKNQYLLRSTAKSNLTFLEAPLRYYETERTMLAHPNFVRPKVLRQSVPDDPMFGQQWHHQNTGQGGGTVDADIDTPLAWDFTTGDDNLVIAVIDNGFEVGHPDLSPNMWTNPGEVAGDGVDNDGNTFIDDINGWDMQGNDNILTGGSHGTNVAGCVGARGGNMTGVSGSCQRCRMILIKTGNTDAQDGLAFDYARAMGADIITNSWGYVVGPVTPLVVQSINDAATLGRGGRGCVVLFAMNNSNVNDCEANPDISSIANVIGVSRATNLDRFDNSGFGNCMDVLGPTRSTNGMTFGTLAITTTHPGGGYTNNFGGTSAATPITAGITGLMLSASPNLTRLQVQRVLQDTADKVEPSLGAYSTTTGFSSPASGHATHGYGRVNAFEAVRLVAPVTPVAPVTAIGRGGVDIMLRDNRLDWGNTEQLSNVVFEPTRGFIPHWESVDLKVDAPPLQPAPVTSQQFDAFMDEDPQATKTNRVYVRVRNRGPVPAESVTVKLHWAFAGTALPSLPGDFWTAFPGDSADTSFWHPMGSQTISPLEYSGASVAGGASDVAQVVGFDFLAPPLDPAQPSFQHYCVWGVIDSPQDRVSPLSKVSLIPDEITPRDNNITHRNLVLQPPTRGQQRLVQFFARNPGRKPLKTMLKATAPDGWRMTLDTGELEKPFDLNGGEERLLTLLIAPPKPDAPGEVVLSQYDLNGDHPVVNGGCTIRFTPPAESRKEITPEKR